MLVEILASYGLQQAQTELFGNGLINRTWKVLANGKQYILQRVEDKIFKLPEDIAFNTRSLAAYLEKNYPDYLFVKPTPNLQNHDLLYLEGEGYYRLFPFVKNSHAIDVVKTPEQAYEAAKEFGKFTRLLSGFNVENLKITLPNFHNLELRYHDFLYALKNGNEERIRESKKTAEALLGHASTVQIYKNILSNPDFKVRVTHHDTKISNVLFDKNEKGLCVIDLDTVMPGYFISDVGDMMRTYLSPVSEEEKNVENITIRYEFYKAIAEGYGGEMKDELTNIEKEHFFYSGCFMIYMQALRFLTDHLNNDIYYGAKYPGQNFTRARNQLYLLELLLHKQKSFKKYLL